MKPRVEVAPRVWLDLEESADFIARDSLDAALRFYDAAEAAFAELARTPGMGVPRNFPNSRLGTVRMWPIPRFEKWLVFYRHVDRGVEILRVVHGARDIAALFGREEPLDMPTEDEP